METALHAELMKFQSTLPAGEATFTIFPESVTSDFNPRFPRGKRHTSPATPETPCISIHASRGGSDGGWFLSASPAYRISIHASRGGSDMEPYTVVYIFKHFNPRFPRGKRPDTIRKADGRLQFQSTLPAGEATEGQVFEEFRNDISIHASRGGSDRKSRNQTIYLFYFNPRFPRGKRPSRSGLPASPSKISIHASRGGSDWLLQGSTPLSLSFQSTLPAGEATLRQAPCGGRGHDFNPRFPRGKRQPRVNCLHIVIQISIHASRGGSDSTVKLSPDDRTKQYGFREP